MMTEKVKELERIAPFLNEEERTRLVNLHANLKNNRSPEASGNFYAELTRQLNSHLVSWAESCVIPTPGEAERIARQIMEALRD